MTYLYPVPDVFFQVKGIGGVYEVHPGFNIGTALLTSGATFASAQAIVPVQGRSGQHRDGDDRQAFRDGFQRGRSDAEHRRRSDWMTTAAIAKMTTAGRTNQAMSAATVKLT